jgi:hypothetical protein
MNNSIKDASHVISSIKIVNSGLYGKIDKIFVTRCTCNDARLNDLIPTAYVVYVPPKYGRKLSQHIHGLTKTNNYVRGIIAAYGI